MRMQQRHEVHILEWRNIDCAIVKTTRQARWALTGESCSKALKAGAEILPKARMEPARHRTGHSGGRGRACGALSFPPQATGGRDEHLAVSGVGPGRRE